MSSRPPDFGAAIHKTLWVADCSAHNIIKEVLIIRSTRTSLNVEIKKQ